MPLRSNLAKAYAAPKPKKIDPSSENAVMIIVFFTLDQMPISLTARK